jgi:serine/threonine-protein kinase
VGADSPKDFGRYELIEQIAAGGMAEIWLARQSSEVDFHRIVVVKKLNEDLAEDERFVGMFLDEARTSAQLSHPNVVQVFDLGLEDGEYFIAMEYIHGEDLIEISHAAVEAQHLIPQPIVVRIVADALKGLHHAHTQVGEDGRPLGIVHRDASPHNLLVTYDGMVKLVDFGIAKARTQVEVTGSGMLKGKHAYMSPEQVRGDPIDHRSDIFTIGSVLFELCTGQRLFEEHGAVATLEAVMLAPIPRPSTLEPDIPERLEAVITRALERDPEARYQSAEAMLLDLERSIPRVPGSAEVGRYMRSLFDPVIAEKERVLDILAKSEPLAPQKLDGFGEGPLVYSGKRKDISTDLFVRKVRRGLAVGTTASGLPKKAPRRARSTKSISDLVQRIVERVPAERRPLAMVLAGPMVGVALVAAAAPVAVWIAGAPKASPMVARAPEARPRPRYEDERKPSPTAELMITSEPPGAEVFIDGRSAGRTPLMLELPRAMTKVRVEHPGYRASSRGVFAGAEKLMHFSLSRVE